MFLAQYTPADHLNTQRTAVLGIDSIHEHLWNKKAGKFVTKGGECEGAQKWAVVRERGKGELDKV